MTMAAVGMADGSHVSTLPVSLVIPVRDEQETLAALVASIEAQTRKPAEVVFVDGGSTDETVAILSVLERTDPRYRVIAHEGPATPGRGRNVGVRHARHDWLALTDAGIRLEPDWLAELWGARRRTPGAEVVYGNFEFDTRSFFEECAAIAYCDPKRHTSAGPCRGPVVVSCLVHRRAFDSVGGFIDARSGEDEAFVRALEAAGVTAAWAPEATVHWRLRPDFTTTMERFRTYSYHYVLAGQAQYWHRPLARSYVPVLIGLVGARWSRWSLVLAATPVLARVAARFHRHAPDTPNLLHRPVRRATLVTAIVLGTDVATAVGWWQARREGR